MDMLQAVRYLRPGTAWVFRDGRLRQAEDGTPRVDPPSNTEIQNVIRQFRYQNLRRPEYAYYGDQLDDIIKVFKKLRLSGIDLGTAGDHIITMSDSVKVRFPKP